MEMRDGQWVTQLEITADSQADLIKKTAALKRVLKQLEKARKTPRRAKGEGALFKRGDGMWVGRIDLGVGRDGKRRRSKPVYSADKATAVEKLNKLRDDMAKGLPEADRTLTVAGWLEHWLEEIAKPRMRPHPWKSARSAVSTRIIPTIGGERLFELGPEQIRYMHKAILAMTYTRGKKGKPIPYTTRAVEEAHNVLSAALSDAVIEGKAHRNVCELVSKPQVLSVARGAITSEQARAVLVAAMKSRDRMVTRWAAGLMLGGRQGEILGLQWGRVDLERGALDLAWQLEWLPLKPDADAEDPNRFDVPAGFEHIPLWRGAALTRPKTAKSQRVIPLPVPLAAILAVHKERWQPNPWDLVWTTPAGTPISDRADREAWVDALSRADVPPAQVHAMRGTTATLLMEAGVDVKVIQSILGHASEVTTRGYQRVDLTLAKRALGNLDGLLELG